MGRFGNGTSRRQDVSATGHFGGSWPVTCFVFDSVTSIVITHPIKQIHYIMFTSLMRRTVLSLIREFDQICFQTSSRLRNRQVMHIETYMNNSIVLIAPWLEEGTPLFEGIGMYRCVGHTFETIRSGFVSTILDKNRIFYIVRQES